MIDADRIKLATVLSAVDENFLVALANKGLVRRALKDLEGQTLKIEETDNAIKVVGPDWSVMMPVEGPAKATDDTIASGITRQILAAAIYLRDNWSPKVLSTLEDIERPHPGCTPPDADTVPTTKSAAPSKTSSEIDPARLRETLLSLTVDDLSKWAGKKLVSDLLVLLNDSMELEVESKLGLLLRLPQHSIEIQIMPGRERGLKLLESMLSTAPKQMHKKWVATAIILLQKRAGKDLKPGLAERIDIESPRTQLQVLQESRKLLVSMMDIGVAHPSTRLIERLFTLSISASAVHLPRLSTLLKTISDQVSQLVSKNVAADSQNLFSTMSRAFCLIKALEKFAEKNADETASSINFPAHLAGVARSQYDPAGDIKLTGIGAYNWQTRSGFHGLTCLFWEAERKRFLSWSISRPSNTFSISDAEQAYNMEQIWSADSADKLCRSSFTLKDARVNPFGRISNAQQSSVAEMTKAMFDAKTFEGRAFSDFADARAYAAHQFPIGLKVSNALDRVVILEPKSWGNRTYDEMRQRFCWEIFDSSNHSIRLTLPWESANERAITFLESLKPALDKINRIVVRLEFSDDDVTFEPISLLSQGSRSDDTVLNPYFDQQLIEIAQTGLLDRLRAKFGRQPRIQTTLSDDESWDHVQNYFDINEQSPPHLIAALSETENLLLQLAESGTKRLNENLAERIQRLGTQLSRWGLSELGASIQSIAEAKGSCGERVLWSDYLCSLHRQLLCMQAVSNK
ncbi:MAG: hypothetical protein EKK48_08115 [Candidatus Melainabacteria bacterium]|nr:MAG: hypothetical protein EKK48_08115 [Candidatus Melainabacteria bacterium]